MTVLHLHSDLSQWWILSDRTGRVCRMYLVTVLFSCVCYISCYSTGVCGVVVGSSGGAGGRGGRGGGGDWGVDRQGQITVPP